MGVRVKNNKTNLEYDLSYEQWQAKKSNGDSNRYTVISQGVAKDKTVAPKTTYDTLKEEAEAAFDAKDYPLSLEKFTKLNAINSNKKTTDKIKEIKDLIAGAGAEK